MKILFVSPAAAISISDVSRGYMNALIDAGHEVVEYSLRARFEYHSRAVPPTVADPAMLSRMASETILNEAMYHKVDYVIIISGLNVHPIALWLLGQANIPVAVVLTESPYDDESQKIWADLTHVNSKVDLTIFTNDRYSSMKYGWHHLPPAYDSDIHKPVSADPEYACDVLMIGTGWGERQAFLEAVNWEGIDLKLYGIWPQMTDESPLKKFHVDKIVDNAHAVTMYCSSKICFNIHRRDAQALTPGPRVYELAACGAFQLSDARRDMVTLFGEGIPTFDSPEKLEELIRFYLDKPEERERVAGIARERVAPETFTKRAADLVAVLTQASVEQGV